MGGLEAGGDSALLDQVREWQELQELRQLATSTERTSGELSDADLATYVPTEEALRKHDLGRAEVKKRLAGAGI